MNLKCTECGHEITITQATVSSILHLISGFLPKTEAKGPVWESIKEGATKEVPKIIAGIANQEFGNSTGVKCPGCQETGIWMPSSSEK